MLKYKSSCYSTYCFFLFYKNERIDPLIALNAEIAYLKQMVSRELSNDKGNADDGFGESSVSSTDDGHVTIGDITLDVSRLHQLILKWKSSNDAKLYKAEHEIQRVIEENNRLSQDASTQLEQLAERHQSISELASKDATLQITELQNRLRIADTTIIEHERKFSSINKELDETTAQYKDSERKRRELEMDLNKFRESKKNLENDISSLKEKIEMQKTECSKLAEENERAHLEMKQNETLLRNKLEESESKLKIKKLEKEKIQEAFENVSGLVFGSFEDFEFYYKSMLLDKDKGLEVKDIENKSLQQRLVKLTNENEKLKLELKEALDRKLPTKHVPNTEKHHMKGLDIGVSEKEVKLLMDTICKANTNLSVWLQRWTGDNPQMNDNDSHKRSSEDNCKILENSLMKLDNNLRSDKDTIAKVVKEREELENQCKTLSTEIDR